MIPELDAAGWLQLAVFVAAWTFVAVSFVCFEAMLKGNAKRRDEGQFAETLALNLPLSEKLAAAIEARHP